MLYFSSLFVLSIYGWFSSCWFQRTLSTPQAAIRSWMWSKIDASVSFLFWSLIKLKAQKWRVGLFLGQTLLNNLIPIATIHRMKMKRDRNSLLPSVFNTQLLARRLKSKGWWKCRYKSSLLKPKDEGIGVRAFVLPAHVLKARNRELFIYHSLSYDKKILNVKHFLVCQMFLAQRQVC